MAVVLERTEGGTDEFQLICKITTDDSVLTTEFFTTRERMLSAAKKLESFAPSFSFDVVVFGCSAPGVAGGAIEIKLHSMPGRRDVLAVLQAFGAPLMNAGFETRSRCEVFLQTATNEILEFSKDLRVIAEGPGVATLSPMHA